LFALNLAPDPAHLALPVLAPASRVELSTDPGGDGRPAAGSLDLAGDEGVVVRLD
jgi:hypothetical protein